MIYLLVSSESPPPSLFPALILCVLSYKWTTSSLPFSSTFLGAHTNITPWVVVWSLWCYHWILHIDIPGDTTLTALPLWIDTKWGSGRLLYPSESIQAFLPKPSALKKWRNTVCAGTLIKAFNQELSLQDVVPLVTRNQYEIGWTGGKTSVWDGTEEKMTFICKFLNLVDVMNLHAFTLGVHWLLLPDPHQASSKGGVCVCVPVACTQWEGLRLSAPLESVSGLTFAWGQQMPVWTDLSHPFRTVRSHEAVPTPSMVLAINLR